MLRTDWDNLPDGVRAAIQSETGPVVSAETVSEGLNSALAAKLRTVTDTIFIKGLRTDHPGVVTQRREAAINPYVRDLSPRLLWRVLAEEWDVLAFEYVAGRHADYSPGSPDLPLVIDTMRRLSSIPCPEVPVLKYAEQRWSEYLDDPADRDLLAGDALLHSDWNPLNVVISGDAARLIDWAWPTRGAAWIDPACLVLRLIAAGHTPVGAEEWARHVDAWDTKPEAITMFATANARLWRDIAHHDQAPWKRHMATAAQHWATHRAQ